MHTSIHISNTKKASVTVKFEQSKQSKQILMHPGTGRGPCFHVPKTITLLYVQENIWAVPVKIIWES